MGAAAAAMLLAVVLAPRNAVGFVRTFSKNSIIIPVDTTSQTDAGTMGSYGLIYRWLRQGNVTIYWIINSQKTAIDGVDLTCNSVALIENDVSPVAVTTPFTNAAGDSIDDATPVDYIGAPFVIAAEHAERAIALLASHSDFKVFRDSGNKWVNLHQAQIAFSADVSRIMNEPPPRVALLGNGAVDVLRGYMDNAGIGLADFTNSEGCFPGSPSCAAGAGHGEIYDVLDADNDFTTQTGYPNGRVNAKDSFGAQVYRVLWTPHWDGKSPNVDNIRENIATFVDRGNGLFAECASIETFEGSFKDAAADACSDGVILCEGDLVPPEIIVPPDPGCETIVDDGVNHDLQCIACSETARDGPPYCERGNGDNQPCDGWRDNMTGDTNLVCTKCKDESGDQSNSNHTPPNCKDPSKDNYCVEWLVLPTAPGGWIVDDGVTHDLACTDCGRRGSPVDGDPYCRQNQDTKECKAWTDTKTGRTDLICIECRDPATDSSDNKQMPPKCEDPNKRNSCAVWSEPPPDPPAECLPDNFDGGGGGGASGSDPGCQCYDFDPTTGAPGASRFGYTSIIEGHPATRFMTKHGIVTNGLGNYPDSTDDSIIYRDVINPFAQKGDWTFTGTGGHVHNWKPLVDSAGSDGYKTDVIRFASSHNEVNAAKHDWDFLTFRRKDGDSSKGVIVYLAGHDYSGSVAGTRIVMNTMLNLSFELTSTELARSEPVFYNVDSTPTLFLGTYEQTSPPGPATYLEEFDTAGYDPTLQLAAQWRFPYHPGHFRAYDGLRSGKNDFTAGVKWDGSTNMPAPGSRTMFTTLGETKVDFAVASLAAGCLDVNNDSVCDLAQAMAVTGDSTQYHSEKHIISRVRGFCLKHQGGDNFAPGYNDCDIEGATNVAILGGIDHSSPAIVGPRLRVSNGARRPTVAYAGARDGQLHAFYVTGGDSWTPTGGGSFTAPDGGAELWSYVPEVQLPLLRYNDAAVDASPVVQDVFAVFPNDGVRQWRDGVRQWRTVLVMASGDGSENIFALDISEPTNPTLLWSITRGSTGHPKTSSLPFFRSTAKKFVALNKNLPTTDGTQELYDYSDLGHAFGLAMGPILAGIEFRYVVFACTNFGPNTDKRLEVFAIDAVTGKRLWQFERDYSSSDTDNTAPGACALLDRNRDGAYDRVVVGDMDGKLWEINALTGENPNADDEFDYALLDTNDSSHPITTSAGVFRTTVGGRLAIVVGTAGADWVSQTVEGRIYAIDYNNRRDLSNALEKTAAQANGLAKPLDGFPISLGEGERVYGAPKIAGGRILVTTSFGDFSGDISGSRGDAGRILSINQSGDIKELETPGKAFGGVAVDTENNAIYGASASGVSKSEQTQGTGQSLFGDDRSPVVFDAWTDQPGL